MTLKEQIQKHKNENPTWGYRRIAQYVGCNHNTVKYHLKGTERLRVKKSMREQRMSTNYKLYRKIAQFCNCAHNKWHVGNRTQNQIVSTIPTEHVIAKFGPKPKCYLTGTPIDLSKPETYSLDHITPLCQGGESNLENLGLCTRQSNVCKNGLTEQAFVELCIKILTERGYSVSK